MTSASENPMDTLAVNVTFTLAFAAFLRIGEFTYPASALENRYCLQQDHLTIPRISLAVDHMLLVLPRSKTDKFNQGITIRIACIKDEAYTSMHMEKWLTTRPGSSWPPLHTPLFEFADKTLFARERLVDILPRRLVNINECPTTFTGHSFHISAA
jgi:hypothetical protein